MKKTLKLYPPTPPGSSGVLELCLVFPLPNPPPGADQTEKNYVDPPQGGGTGGGANGRAHWAGPNCDRFLHFVWFWMVLNEFYINLYSFVWFLMISISFYMVLDGF